MIHLWTHLIISVTFDISFVPRDGSLCDLLLLMILLFALDMLPLGMCYLSYEVYCPAHSLLWPNLLLSFVSSRKSLQVLQDNKLVVIALFGILDILCFMEVSLSTGLIT